MTPPTPNRRLRRASARAGAAALLLVGLSAPFAAPALADPVPARMVDQGDDCDPDPRVDPDDTSIPCDNTTFRGFTSGIYPNATRSVDEVATLDRFHIQGPSGLQSVLAYCLDIDLPKSLDPVFPVARKTEPTAGDNPDDPGIAPEPFWAGGTIAQLLDLYRSTYQADPFAAAGITEGDLGDAEALAKARLIAMNADTIGTPVADVAFEAAAVQTAIYVLVDGADVSWLPGAGAESIIDRVNELLDYVNDPANAGLVADMANTPTAVSLTPVSPVFQVAQDGTLTIEVRADYEIFPVGSSEPISTPMPDGTVVVASATPDQFAAGPVTATVEDGIATFVFDEADLAGLNSTDFQVNFSLQDDVQIEAAIFVPDPYGNFPDKDSNGLLDSDEPTPVQPYVAAEPIVLNASATANILPPTPVDDPVPPTTEPPATTPPAPPTTVTPPPVPELPFTGTNLTTDLAILGGAAAAAGALIRRRARRTS